MTKRDFLRTTAVAGTALMTSPLSALFSELPGTISLPVKNYEKGLFPFFWAEDLIGLLHLSDVPEPSLQALNVNREHFQFGRSWNIGRADALRVLRESRKLIAGKQETDRARTQYALVAGWAAARLLDDRLGATPPDRAKTLTTDARIVRHLHAAGGGTINPGTRIEDIAEVFHLMQQRNLIRLHTFRPEFGEGERWIGDFLAYYHEMKVANTNYARAYLRPLSELQSETLELFRPVDRTIELATDLRLGRLTSKIGLRESIEARPSASVYGKALAEALPRQESLARYVTGKIDENDLML